MIPDWDKFKVPAEARHTSFGVNTEGWPLVQVADHPLASNDSVHPYAGTWSLVRDEGTPRGLAYVREVNEPEIWELERRMRVLQVPAELQGVPNGGRMQYDVPGMIKAFIGVPYRIRFPDLFDRLKIKFPVDAQVAPSETQMCVHSIGSLKHYPGGGNVAEKTKRLFALTFGEGEERPIWEHLSRNSRSKHTKKVDKGGKGEFDGSYSLAGTIGQGQGRGIAFVAAQPALAKDPVLAARVNEIITLNGELAKFVLKASLTEFEYQQIQHFISRNNVHVYGGGTATSLQMNVSSSGIRNLFDALGYQGGVHLDKGDEPGGYTVVGLACQWSPSKFKFLSGCQSLTSFQRKEPSLEVLLVCKWGYIQWKSRV